MRVELLFWDADPEYMTARQRLVEVLIEDAFETPIQMIAVSTADDAQFLALPGSPTIRLDGADIDPEGAGAVGLYLRTYATDTPGAAGAAGAAEPERAPSKALIRAAVDRARGWSHGRREVPAVGPAGDADPG